MTPVALPALAVLAVLTAAATAPPAAAAGTLADYRLLVLDGSPVKWGPPAPGTGAVVTFAVAVAQAGFDQARNCAAVEPIIGLLAHSEIGRSDFDRQVQAAFDAWSAVADITFVPGDPASADILIGAQGTPRGRAFTNVTRSAPVPGGARGTIVHSVICLNPEVGWKIGFDGNLAVYDLRYTLMHEIGHAIGLDHPGVPGLVMDFRYREAFAALQSGDRAGAIEVYGARSIASRVVPRTGSADLLLPVSTERALSDADKTTGPALQ